MTRERHHYVQLPADDMRVRSLWESSRQCQTGAVSTIPVLDREMYSEVEAARLLRVAPSTLHYWLEGGERRDRISLTQARLRSGSSPGRFDWPVPRGRPPTPHPCLSPPGITR